MKLFFDWLKGITKSRVPEEVSLKQKNLDSEQHYDIDGISRKDGNISTPLNSESHKFAVQAISHLKDESNVERISAGKK